MARKKKRGSRKRGIRVAATIGIVAGLWQSYQNYKKRGINGVVRGISGWDMEKNDWAWQRMNATIPMVAGAGVSMAASKIGLNRYTPARLNI